METVTTETSGPDLVQRGRHKETQSAICEGSSLSLWTRCILKSEKLLLLHPLMENIANG